MSAIEDFRNAPAGVTATTALGSRAMKVIDGTEQRWCDQNWSYFNDEEMTQQGYTLDPSAPATAREALDLAWDFAHEVKPGQVIPKGARYLEVHNSGVREYTAPSDLGISPEIAPITRTLEPLPEPEPDWLDAPAVMATCWYCETKALHGPLEDRRCWECAECQIATTWRALTDVTPLYPKGQEA